MLMLIMHQLTAVAGTAFLLLRLSWSRRSVCVHTHSEEISQTGLLLWRWPGRRLIWVWMGIFFAAAVEHAWLTGQSLRPPIWLAVNWSWCGVLKACQDSNSGGKVRGPPLIKTEVSAPLNPMDTSLSLRPHTPDHKPTPIMLLSSP